VVRDGMWKLVTHLVTHLKAHLETKGEAAVTHISEAGYVEYISNSFRMVYSSDGLGFITHARIVKHARIEDAIIQLQHSAFFLLRKRGE